MATLFFATTIHSKLQLKVVVELFCATCLHILRAEFGITEDFTKENWQHQIEKTLHLIFLNGLCHLITWYTVGLVMRVFCSHALHHFTLLFFCWFESFEFELELKSLKTETQWEKLPSIPASIFKLLTCLSESKGYIYPFHHSF